MKKRILSVMLVLGILLLSSMGIAESDWINVLLLGCDLGSPGMDYGRSDTMIIASINPKQGLLKFTSIMRDVLVRLPGHGVGKINAATVYGGPEYSMEIVNQSFGLDIEKYILINIAGLVSIIDAIGGIDVEITEQEMQYLNEHTIDTVLDIGAEQETEQLTRAGLVHLSGVQAVQHARNRTTDDSDYVRSNRQRQVILAISEKLMNECTVTELIQAAKEMMEYVETNFSILELTSLATVATKIDIDAIEELRIPVDGTFEAGMKDGTWSIRPDFERNTKLLQEFIFE